MNAQRKAAFMAARVGVPFELMKFRFTFDGKLHTSGSNNGPRPDDQWAIRRQLYPQLAELWRSHPALSGLGLSVKMPHIYGGNLTLAGPQPIDIEPSMRVRSYLTETIAVDGYNFLPLVRKSLELTCELKITFLRRGEPGALVLPGGDLDNRIKTFFDGLKVPDSLTGNRLREGDPPDPDPFLCLLEQDSLITGVFVETDRLLSPDRGSANDARLLVEATIRVMRITPNNVGFLGD